MICTDNILDLNMNELKNWLKFNGEKEFRAKQIFDWIYKNEWDFSLMKNLPQSLIEKLNNAFYIDVPRIIDFLKSSDDDTTKYLLGYSDGNIIESVVMKYKHGNSICVSTQVGCKMGCKFCASTIGGITRNLTSGEILGQILRCQQHLGERISNIVMMGSGEPLDNYDNVMKFIETVNADYGLNIGQRHITLSTCGIIPNIIKLADKNLQITLAISFHAPNDEKRQKMMPINIRYPIKELLDACRYYINKTNRRITFEYALVKDVNDSNADAKELAELFKGMLCHVNLIPVNEVVENNFRKPSSESVKAFLNILTSYGIETTVRREMGSDINAACGQLRRSYLDNKEHTKGV